MACLRTISDHVWRPAEWRRNNFFANFWLDHPAKHSSSIASSPTQELSRHWPPSALSCLDRLHAWSAARTSTRAGPIPFGPFSVPNLDEIIRQIRISCASPWQNKLDLTTLTLPLKPSYSSNRVYYGWWIVLAAFLNLFFVVGIIFYGFPFFYPYFVESLCFTRVQLT